MKVLGQIGVWAITACLLMGMAPTPKKEAKVNLMKTRRENLLAAAQKEEGKGTIVVLIPAALPADTDQYRENHYFRYFSGVDAPRGVLAISSWRGKPFETLFLPDRDRQMERWVGESLNAGALTPSLQPDKQRKKAMAATGVRSVQPLSKLYPMLSRWLGGASVVYLPMAEASLEDGIPRPQAMSRTIGERFPQVVIKDLRPLADDLRRVKDEVEIANIHRAGDITAEAHKTVMKKLRPGMMEYQLQAWIEWAFTFHRGGEFFFPSIGGSGPNSCILHYEENDRKMKKGDLVVVDIGTTYDGYCADVTRTYPVSGRFSKRQREIYDIVLKAQKAGIAAMKPGVLIRDVHKAAKKVIDDAGYGKYFFHGTSHYLGIDVHDVGNYEKPLEVGVVITVEPGIYISEENLGVRIEDDVLVTAKGHKVLSAKAPKDPDMIEKMMAGKTK